MPGIYPDLYQFLGVEANALRGFFVTLQSIFFGLDLGFCRTQNREISHLAVLERKAQEMRNLIRTQEGTP